MNTTGTLARILPLVALFLAGFGLLTPVLAQEAGPQPPAGLAAQRDAFPDQRDKAVQGLVDSLVGMHRGDDHTLYVTRVEIPGSSPALYAELVIAGEESKPVRQQLWVPYKKDGVLQMRISELPLGMRDLVVGMWAAPSLYPKAELGQYAGLGDALVDGGEGSYTVRNRLPMPIAREGAISYEFRLEVTPESIRWTDAGAALNGDRIFDVDASMRPKGEAPGARELDGGVLVYDLREGFAGASPVNKDSIVFDYHEWTMDGFLIDTTVQEHRGGHVFTIPDEKKALRSWNIGIIGLRQGGIRRIYDPRSSNGMLQGQKKPFNGQALPIITQLECISVKDNTPD